jgi:hypothetical protein
MTHFRKNWLLILLAFAIAAGLHLIVASPSKAGDIHCSTMGELRCSDNPDKIAGTSELRDMNHLEDYDRYTSADTPVVNSFRSLVQAQRHRKAVASAGDVVCLTVYNALGVPFLLCP